MSDLPKIFDHCVMPEEIAGKLGATDRLFSTALQRIARSLPEDAAQEGITEADMPALAQYVHDTLAWGVYLYCWDDQYAANPEGVISEFKSAKDGLHTALDPKELVAYEAEDYGLETVTSYGIR